MVSINEGIWYSDPHTTWTLYSYQNYLLSWIWSVVLSCYNHCDSTRLYWASLGQLESKKEGFSNLAKCWFSTLAMFSSMKTFQNGTTCLEKLIAKFQQRFEANMRNTLNEVAIFSAHHYIHGTSVRVIVYEIFVSIHSE